MSKTKSGSAEADLLQRFLSFGHEPAGGEGPGEGLEEEDGAMEEEVTEEEVMEEEEGAMEHHAGAAARCLLATPSGPAQCTLSAGRPLVAARFTAGRGGGTTPIKVTH